MKSYKTFSELPGSQYFRDVVIGRTQEPRQAQGIGSRPDAQATPEEEQSMFEAYAAPILRRLGMMSDDPEVTAQTVVPQLQPNRFPRSTNMEAWSRLPPPPTTGSIEGVLNSVRQTREALRDTGERGSNMNEMRRRVNNEPDPVNVEGSTRGAIPVSQQQGADYQGGDYEDTSVRLTQDLMRDFDLTETQAAAFVGNLAVESNNFQTLQEINPIVEGSRGGFGYAQWTGPRREAFEAWAAENELDPSSYEANYGYLKKELSETDDVIGNIGRNTIDRLRDMDNLNEATSFVMEYYLRPGIQHEGRRQESAAEILGLMARQE